jgi:thiol:disulfide interchange protein
MQLLTRSVAMLTRRSPIGSSVTSSPRAQQQKNRQKMMACVAALLTLALAVPTVFAAPIKTPHVEVELLAESARLVPGTSANLGIRIRHTPEWHTYWTNPGDAGYALRLAWTLPEGVTVGNIQWPLPKRIFTGDPKAPITNFGYDGEVLLLIPVSVGATVKTEQTLTLVAHADWLVCRDMCIPEEGELKLTLPVQATAVGAPINTSPEFVSAKSTLPTTSTDWKAEVRVAERNVLLQLDVPQKDRSYAQIEVFSVAEGSTDTSVHVAHRTETGYAVQLRLAGDAKSMDPMNFVVATMSPASEQPARRSVLVSAPVLRGSVALPTDAIPMGVESGETTQLSVFAAILLAFAGGLVLNLMPCVFPVLSLKILGFAFHAGDGENGRKAMRMHGLAYAGGVVISFLALASLLLALRAGGAAVGWGFQLQSPLVVWGLAVVFCLIGLNLVGAFEFGQFAPSSVLSFQAKRPSVDAFLGGVLAVVAASPCTAPFMGAALGFAIAQGAWVSLAVFLSLGLGMALPYVVLAWFPAWLKRLPKPGAWMIRLKQGLAFPMFATVVWLVWVLSLQSGADAAAVSLLGLIGVAMGAWLLGMNSRNVGWAGVAMMVAAVVIASPQGPVAADTAGNPLAKGAVTSVWQPWSPDRVVELTAQGVPVFVDFTAAWCVSCQANKRMVLSRADIERDFALKHIVLLRADWTNRDERITRALATMGRSGVPAYAFYAPGKPIQLLPEVLTKGTVRSAIGAL